MRHVRPLRLGRLEVDEQFKFRRLRKRNVLRLPALEASGISGPEPSASDSATNAFGKDSLYASRGPVYESALSTRSIPAPHLAMYCLRPTVALTCSISLSYGELEYTRTQQIGAALAFFGAASRSLSGSVKAAVCALTEDRASAPRLLPICRRWFATWRRRPVVREAQPAGLVSSDIVLRGDVQVRGNATRVVSLSARTRRSIPKVYGVAGVVI